MTAAELLRRVSLFADLRDEERAALANCLYRRVFARDMILFHKGSPARSLYLIESGAVRIFALSDAGDEITLGVYGPGDCFGETALLDGNIRSNGATALERTVVYGLSRDDFLRCLEAHPGVVRRVMALMAHRIDAATAYSEALAFLDVPGRLASVLLELAARWGGEGDGAEITLRQSQTDLANWCACSREMVNKVLQQYQKLGLIATDGRAIRITNSEGLRSRIGGAQRPGTREARSPARHGALRPTSAALP